MKEIILQIKIILKELKKENLIAFKYCDENGLLMKIKS